MSPTSSLRSLCVLPLASGPYHCLCNGNSSFLPRRLPSSVLQPPSTSQGKYAHVLVVSSSCHLIPRTMLLCSISSSSSGGQGTRRWGLPLPMGALVSQGGMGLGAMASLHCPYLSPSPGLRPCRVFPPSAHKTRSPEAEQCLRVWATESDCLSCGRPSATYWLCDLGQVEDPVCDCFLIYKRR